MIRFFIDSVRVCGNQFKVLIHEGGFSHGDFFRPKPKAFGPICGPSHPVALTSLIETFRVRHYSLKKIVGATQGQMNKVAVAFKVDSNEKGIFELENMQALDDRENPVPWMAPGPFNFYDPNFEEGLDGEIIAYLQEENDTEHLTISRELKVTPDRRIEVEFPDGKPA